MDICIVNYNTQKLTDYAIRSINKHTPGCDIYVFDNSDKEPFKSNFKNVKIIDNTKGQIINFDEWLKKYPNSLKSSAKVNAWGSAKHCYTIEKCMELFPNGFILMDSDILVLKDFSDIVDESCVFVGEVEMQAYPARHERVLPFICYINSKLCKEKGIHYFDDAYMHGLRNTAKNPKCDEYDTGAAFFINASKYKYKRIRCKDYITHFKGGSWNDLANRKFGAYKNEDAWLTQFRRAWDSPKKKVIYTCISGNYDTLKEPKFVDPEFDYICFTDQDITSNFWEIRPLPKDTEGLSQVKKQRKIKVNPHLYLPDYEFSVWVDANVELRGSVEFYVEENCPKERGVFSVGLHPQRDCVYDEFEACLRYKKDTKEIMGPQVEGYKAEGYPEHNGMVQTGILLRYHNDPECKKIDEMWWREIEVKSHRDQISFNYVLWKIPNAKVNFLSSSIFKCETFYWSAGHKAPIVKKEKKPIAQDKPIIRNITSSRAKIKRWNGIMM